MTIGILAIQGDYARHQKMIEHLGQHAIQVRTRTELQACDGLIIPGGESTTLAKLLRKHLLWDAVIRFGREKAIYGTCAGLILLGTSPILEDIEAMGLIDITVQRNAYGRQVDSFITSIDMQLNGHPVLFEGVFIRAPKILSVGDTVQPLAWHKDSIVMAESKQILVSTFHPELTDDPTIHKYFIHKVAASLHRADLHGAA